jgi:hypothetical protein
MFQLDIFNFPLFNKKNSDSLLSYKYKKYSFKNIAELGNKEIITYRIDQDEKELLSYYRKKCKNITSLNQYDSSLRLSAELIDNKQYYWPPCYSKHYFIQNIYNCIVFYCIKTYFAVSTDAIHIIGEGKTKENALQDLQSKIEKQIQSGYGGVFICSSSHEFQMNALKDFEELLIEEKYQVISKTCESIIVFP